FSPLHQPKEPDPGPECAPIAAMIIELDAAKIALSAWQRDAVRLPARMRPTTGSFWVYSRFLRPQPEKKQTVRHLPFLIRPKRTRGRGHNWKGIPSACVRVMKNRALIAPSILCTVLGTLIISHAALRRNGDPNTSYPNAVRLIPEGLDREIRRVEGEV